MSIRKLGEAVKFLKIIYDDRAESLNSDMPGQQAIQLGVEALERLELIRQEAAMNPCP